MHRLRCIPRVRFWKLMKPTPIDSICKELEGYHKSLQRVAGMYFTHCNTYWARSSVLLGSIRGKKSIPLSLY